MQNNLTLRRETGQLEPRPHAGGPRRLLGRRHERVLRSLLRARNDRTDAEYAQQLAEKTGLRVSRRTLNKTWRRFGITRKKKTLHASERERPDVLRARRAFRKRARRRGHRRFIFLDEFGTHLGLTRLYGRSPRGRRAVGAVPDNPDPNVTLTIGLARDGIVAPSAVPGGTDGSSFETYARDYLGPELRPGDIVVADQLGAHRARGARAAIEARGAEFRLLSPYSPDMTPDEEAGAKIKAAGRGANPRSVPDLYEVMGRAIGAVSVRDAAGCFSDRAAYLAGRTKSVRPRL